MAILYRPGLFDRVFCFRTLSAVEAPERLEKRFATVQRISNDAAGIIRKNAEQKKRTQRKAKIRREETLCALCVL